MKEGRKLAEGLVEGLVGEGDSREAESAGLEVWREQAGNVEVAGDESRSGKKKVTYYLSESLQNQLKVRAAVEGQAMSEVVEQALRFYLEHGDIVKRDGVGHTHQLYACPACQSMLVFRQGELKAVSVHALPQSVLVQD